jgi:hypothetical protein
MGRCLDALATVGAKDLISIGKESTSYEGTVATVASKAIAVPMTVIERDELGASKTSDGFGASDAFLGKEIAKAVSTVWLVVTGRELLSGQSTVAVGADKAVTVEWGTLVRDTSLVDHPITFSTPLGKLFLVAWYTDKLIVTRDEALVANGLLADIAAKAFFMPLLAAELKLLHSSTEDVTTSITSGSKVIVMALGTVEFVFFGCEGLVHK